MFSSKIVNASVASLFGLVITTGSMVAHAGKGPSDAVAVCEAVARDDSSELARLLTEYRPRFSYSYTNLAPKSNGLRDASEAYECNGMSLDDFAERIGAEKTAALLENGQLVDGDFVAESSDSQTKPNS